MNILLVSLPVCMPTVMPYSLAMLKGEITSQLNESVSCLDLNAEFHYNEFRAYYDLKEKQDFFPVLEMFLNKARSTYPFLSRAVLTGEKPQGFDALFNRIVDQNPDFVALSLTYNSQIFFAKSFIEELKKRNIPVVIGGPADFSKIMEGTTVLSSAQAFVDFLVEKGAKKKETSENTIADYSDFDKKFYFTKDLVYPLRTALSCPYKRCTFCTHHGNAPYKQMDLSQFKETIVQNNMKKVCIIDDDIPSQRLLELSDILGPLGVKWWCQLRPLKQLIPLFPKLKEAGLCSIAWGVESGSQMMLDTMEKGTKVEDVKEVLAAAKKAGFHNMTYILFGLPGETEETFEETVLFLESNKENIDLVSQSVFGLQQGSRLFDNPEQFGVSRVELKKRTLLSDSVSYTPTEGLTQEEAQDLKKKNQPRILAVNSVPKIIAAAKEQILNYE